MNKTRLYTNPRRRTLKRMSNISIVRMLLNQERKVITKNNEE